jgi:hypothetical protein
MGFFSNTYTTESAHFGTAEPRARFGGSRRPQAPATRYERDEFYGMTTQHGSHMPLDTVAHWDWRNPLNILPALLLMLLVIAVVALVLA